MTEIPSKKRKLEDLGTDNLIKDSDIEAKSLPRPPSEERPASTIPPGLHSPTPSNEEVKIMAIVNKPIIITLPFTKPNTEIRLFSNIYHVPSGLLKLHSAYFGTLLEKHEATKTDDEFKYRFYLETKGDKWELKVGKSPEEAVIDSAMSPSEQLTQERAFHNILNALSNKDIDLKSCSDIVALASVAEKLQVLHTLGNALNSALFKNSAVVFKTINMDPCALLIAAQKLRHKDLFNDAFILSLSPWTTPRYLTELEDHLILKEMLGLAHFDMCRRLDTFSMQVFYGLARTPGRSVPSFPTNIIALAPHANQNDMFCMPGFVRACDSSIRASPTTIPDLRDSFADILVNRLRLCPRNVKAGEGVFKDSFLSWEIPRYPWDDTEWA